MRDGEGENDILTSDMTDKSPVGPVSTEACVWCGAALAEAEAFMLRVWAKLCPACAERAGRIAAEQGRTAT